RYPLLLAPLRLGRQLGIGAGADDLGEGRTGDEHMGDLLVQLAIARVAQHQPIVAIEQHEAFGNRLDRIDEARLGDRRPLLGERLLGQVATGAAIALETAERVEDRDAAYGKMAQAAMHAAADEAELAEGLAP